MLPERATTGRSPERSEAAWKLLLLFVLLGVGEGIGRVVLTKFTSPEIASLIGNLFLLSIAVMLGHTANIRFLRAAEPRPSVEIAVLVVAGVSALAMANIAGVAYQFLHSPTALDRACTPNNETWATLLQGLLISPVVEEVFFSGLLLASFRSRFGAQTAICLTSLLFAVIHVPSDLPQLFNRIAYEMLACALIMRTGALLAGIAAHMLTNFSVFLLDRLEAECRWLLTSATSEWAWLGVWLAALTLLLILVHRILASPRRQTE